MIYRAWNRGNRRETVLHKPADFDAFVAAMNDAQRRIFRAWEMIEPGGCRFSGDDAPRSRRAGTPVEVPAKRNHSRLWQTRDRIVSENRPLSGWLSDDDTLLWRGTLAPRDAAWWERVNEPLSCGDWQRLRHSVLRGLPFGNDDWTRPTAQALGLESCLRPPGRPKKS